MPFALGAFYVIAYQSACVTCITQHGELKRWIIGSDELNIAGQIWLETSKANHKTSPHHLITLLFIIGVQKILYN